MTMIVLLVILAVVAFAATVVRQGGSAARALPRAPIPPRSDEFESPSELALRDPVEALWRYGTTDDAARLAEQGVDLTALGYRPRRD
jgi:hypothetical protein